MITVRSVAFALSLFVAGCGGGGGSHNPLPNPNPDPNPTPPTLPPTSPPTTPPPTTPGENHKLTIVVTGSGTVSSSPAGIDCGSDCEETFAAGTSVILTAVPASGFHLGGWGNACSVANATCTVSLKDDVSVNVVFAENVVPPEIPVGLSAQAGNTQVDLRWNAAPRATGYKLYRGETVIATPATSTFIDTKVVNGTSYTYEVSATNTAGESAKSNSVRATPMIGGGQMNCEARPSSCGYPDDTNTGVKPGTQLTLHEGNMKIDTAYKRVSGMLIRGCVEVEAPGVTIIDSKIVCDGPYAIKVIGHAKNALERLGIENVDLELGDNTIGIGSRNILIRRLRSHGGAHAGSFEINVTIEDSFISGIKAVNGTTSDGLQFTRHSRDIVVKHNTILAYSIVNDQPVHVTAAIEWTPEQGAKHMTLQDNLLAGGGITLYCPQDHIIPDPFGLEVLNNRFGSHLNGHTAYCDNNQWITFTGNYRDQDLTPL